MHDHHAHRSMVEQSDRHARLKEWERRNQPRKTSSVDQWPAGEVIFWLIMAVFVVFLVLAMLGAPAFHDVEQWLRHLVRDIVKAIES